MKSGVPKKKPEKHEVDEQEQGTAVEQDRKAGPIDEAPKAVYQPPKISLEGITLEMMVTRLVEVYGWAELGKLISINCFLYDPSIKSSLHFLRRTPWARKKVETLYVKLRKAQLKKQMKKNSQEG